MEKKISKSLVPFKQSSSIKSKCYSRGSLLKKSISESSESIPKKRYKKKSELLSEIFVKKKTKQKMDLISENMQRDRQNLKNPSEFYADLFSNFVVHTQKINGSGISGLPALPMIKISRYEES